MNTNDKLMLTASVEVDAPIEKVWKLWTAPEDIIIWNAPSGDWHTASVENDVREGGRFLFVMATLDGKDKFDYTGRYDKVKTHELIAYTLDDERTTNVTFSANGKVKITETFEAVNDLLPEMQRGFCQAVLNSFKKYAEDKD